MPASKKLHLSSMSKYPGSLMPELQALVMKMRDPSVHAYPYIQPMCFIAYHPLVPVTLQLLEQLELPFSLTFPSLHPSTLHFFRATSSLACYKICPLVQKAPVQLRDSGKDLLTISVLSVLSYSSFHLKTLSFPSLVPLSVSLLLPL